jgi:hypothetical protein
MNEFFQKINTDTHYTSPVPLLIPEGTRIPTVDENSVKNIMINLKRTGPGPDGFPYWLWKDFASYLVPVLTRILNSSLEQQRVPTLWKLANLAPIPKELPLSNCDQLRPISLTNIIMRLLLLERINSHIRQAQILQLPSLNVNTSGLNGWTMKKLIL